MNRDSACPDCEPAFRCDCGRLLGSIVAGKVRTKCRRCKRVVDLSAPAEATTEIRCHCGRLLARVFERVVEVRCPRCKQTARIPAPG